MEFTFTANGDYKTEFVNYVTALFDKAHTYTQAKRTQLAGHLIEAYFHTTGQTPAGGQLDRLGTFILHDVITDKKSNKSKTMEYNILSDSQLEEREKGERDFGLSEQYGTDGVKHGAGKRNTKTKELE